MSENKKLKAEIVVLIHYFGEYVALLPERGYINTEKWNSVEKARESWTGGSQLTAAGSAQDNEDAKDALTREIDEELGEDIAEIISLGFVNNKVQLLNTDDDGERIVKSYGILVDEDFLKKINYKPYNRAAKLTGTNNDWIRTVQDFLNLFQLPISGGAVRPVSLAEVHACKNLKDYPKNPGVTDRRELALFNDAKTTIIKAFERLVPNVAS